MVSSGGALALIPARGGSKSVPRKNLRLLAGHPLVAHSIAAAQASKRVERTIVSTDDPEIVDVSRRYGAEVPFLRPVALAQDDTPDLPVFQHALRWLADHEGYRPEAIVHLRPTTPLRRPEHVDSGVDLLLGHEEADAVRSVIPPFQNPFKMWTIDAAGYLAPLLRIADPEPYNMPRQALPPMYWHNGYIDVTRWRTVMELGSMTGQRIIPLIQDSGDWVDIDTETEFAMAELLIRSGRVISLLPPGGGVLLERAIALVVLDFDGVMTDNRVWVDEAGRESVAFDRSDGMGVMLLQDAGVQVLVLSSEMNPVVAARCRKLGVPFEHGLQDKRRALEAWAEAHRVDLRQAVYVGNDINDLDCMRAVGLAVAVSDAHPQARECADVVLTRPGGHGAIRELYEWILRGRRSSLTEES